MLFFIGARMSYESLKPEEVDQSEQCPDPTRGFSLVMLSFATSIDALGVGFSLGIMGERLLLTAVWIGIAACAMTWVAMKLGNRLSRKFGRRVGMIGGAILMGIAIKLLI